MDIMTKAVVGNSCRIRSFTQFEIKTQLNILWCQRKAQSIFAMPCFKLHALSGSMIPYFRLITTRKKRKANTIMSFLDIFRKSFAASFILFWNPAHCIPPLPDYLNFYILIRLLADSSLCCAFVQNNFFNFFPFSYWLFYSWLHKFSRE